MAQGVFDVNDVEGAVVALTVCDQPDSSQVSPASHHDEVADVELDEVLDLSRFNVDLDSVVDGDLRIGVTDSAAIVCDTERDAFLA